MSSSRILSTLLAVLTLYCCAFALDDDFDFDISDDFEVEFPLDGHKKSWGVADNVATVNRIFHLAIPKGSLKDVKHFEAKVDQNKPLPSWLLFDKTNGIFWGVPLEGDVGNLDISIKAVSLTDIITNEFMLTVKEESDLPEGIDKCSSIEDNTVLALIIDKGAKAIKPKQRIIAINNIAKFFGMPNIAFTIKAQLRPDDITDSSVVLAGPGNLKSRSSKLTSLIEVIVGCEGRLWLKSAPIIHQLKQQAKDGTITEVLRLPLVGWRVKTETRSLLRKKRQDDTYTGSGDYEYYEYEDYDDPDREVTEQTLGSNSITSSTTSSIATRTTVTEPVTTPSIVSPTHPHRHHHGELNPVEENLRNNTPEEEDHIITDPTDNIKSEVTNANSVVEEIPIDITTTTSLSTKEITSTITSTSTTTTAKPTTVTTQSSTEQKTEETKPDVVTPAGGLYKPSETLDTDDEYDEEYDDGDDEESETEVPFSRNDISFTPEKPTPEIISDTETTIIDVITRKPTTEAIELPLDTIPPIKVTSQEPIFSVSEASLLPVTTETLTSTSTTTETITEKQTTQEDITTKHSTVRHTIALTTTQKVTTPEATEQIEYEVKNFAPTVQIRLNRIPVTAGKNFTQIVPENMFSDMEDGYNLKLELFDKFGNPLKKDFWCQFNPQTKEIYGLPLEEDISGWEFILKATDREGASVSEKIEIIVQQNKYWRVVNHEFTLFARVEKKHEFLFPIDWALHILKGIGASVHSANTSRITVRKINYTTDPIIFTWTNDSLALNYCPKEEIDELFGILTANDEGDPSISLSNNLQPAIRAKKITQSRMGVCEELEILPPVPITSVSPPHLVPVVPPSNLAPILRNAVDHINATVGELLVYKVPEDTFYDPEDDPRNLKLHLYSLDKQPIPPHHWLQFDGKNKEFYGIPSARDSRRVQYQLVCEDSGGLTASDILVVEIHPSPKLNYNLEFSMTTETDYESFSKNPSAKRKFIEKLSKLFGDHNTSYIHLSSITKGIHDSSIVTWYNKTLTKELCPRDDIKRMESLLVTSERTISNRVHKAMEEFVVSAFRIPHLSICKTINPVTTRTQEPMVPIEESGTTQESNDEYFITFIVPAVIISVMLLLAGIAACVLYRRRRSGKMNLEEDGRQSYGNKGIPVIFQEELDEKPESGTKTPVILKDEKPPLAPPEYSKSGSLKLTDDSEPYQPPPPFARTQDNGRQARPKPTPTYRKPPPYVPP